MTNSDHLLCHITVFIKNPSIYLLKVQIS